MPVNDAEVRDGETITVREPGETLLEIDRWSRRDPDPAAVTFLLSDEVRAAVNGLRDPHDARFAMVSALHRAALDRHLSPILVRVAEDRPIGAGESAALVAAARHDPVSSVFAPAGVAHSPHDVARDRIRLTRSLREPFALWWDSYFSDGSGPSAWVTELWRLYIPFAQWIVREKRRRRPGELFMVGLNGSPGAGKTVLGNALTVVVNHLLDQRTEGRAIARSGDDWYLPRAERERLRAEGYDPGLPGVSNRALPGTHDLAWLRRNLREMEDSTPRSVIRMGSFDKKADDQPTGPDRFFEVRGKVGVLLFDLWFAGAETDVDPLALPAGLRRRVAERLRDWRPVFDRMDALWGFDWPSLEQMTREREAQERLVEQRRGARGMSHDHVRTFMAYMIERAWDWRTTSPVPPEQAMTFRAWRDANHHVIAVRRGGRTW